jgi:hypothetical protein
VRASKLRVGLIFAALIVLLSLGAFAFLNMEVAPDLSENMAHSGGAKLPGLRPSEVEIVAETKHLGGTVTRRWVFAEGWVEWNLDFSYAPIKRHNLTSIFRLFRYPHCLTVLKLRNCGVGDEIIACLNLWKPKVDESGRPTGSDRGFRVLDLAHTRFTKAGIRQIIAVHCGLRSLDLSGLPVDSRCLAGIERYHWLGSLILQDTQLEDGVAPLLARTSLRKLSLANSSLGISFTKALAKPSEKQENLARNLLETLEELDLSGTAINDDALTHIKSFRNLRKLDLSQTCLADEAKLLQLVQSLRHLEHLDLSHTKFSYEALSRVSNASLHVHILK